MALIEILMPKMGESVMEGTILSWLKNVGDKIEQDESILEVATDKVDTDIPSTHEGILKEILVAEGDVVQVGSTIAIIDTEAQAGAQPVEEAPKAVVVEEVEVEKPEPQEAVVIEDEINETVQSFKLDAPVAGRFYSPLVLNIAKAEGISMQDLEYIVGTGQDSRVTKKDILNYINNPKTASTSAVSSPSVESPKNEATKEVVKEAVVKEAVKEVKAQPKAQIVKPVSSPAVSLGGDDEIIEMDRMRKMIAKRMVESVHTSPHVTSFVEADVTNVVHWRRKYKQEMFDKEGESLTYMPIFVEAIAKAIKDFPMINVSIDGDKIIKKKRINIGIAVALPSGNLIVPVIHDVDQLNLVGIAKKINDIARRARANKLKPDELSGGTYTVSNVGSFGNVMGTPILVQPQVGILAIGAIRKKPAVIETPTGDHIAVRHMMYLSHSYDHRVVDGALGGMFVRRVGDYLEQFDIERTLYS